MRCDFCGKNLSKERQKLYQHVNINQSIQIHAFCSKECRENWCYQLQTKKCRIIVIWALGSFLNRYYFIQKYVKAKNLIHFGIENGVSYFSPELDNIKQLNLGDN
jgi:hypothetical protein